MKGTLPAVKVGHGGLLDSTEAPAIGYLDNLRRWNNVLVADIVDIPEQFLEEYDKYPKRSVEIIFEKYLVVSLALLGGTPPQHELAMISSEDAEQQPNGTYTIANVPIFRTTERDGYEYDEEWLDNAVANHKLHKVMSDAESISIKNGLMQECRNGQAAINSFLYEEEVMGRKKYGKPNNSIIMPDAEKFQDDPVDGEDEANAEPTVADLMEKITSIGEMVTANAAAITKLQAPEEDEEEKDEEKKEEDDKEKDMEAKFALLQGQLDAEKAARKAEAEKTRRDKIRTRVEAFQADGVILGELESTTDFYCGLPPGEADKRFAVLETSNFQLSGQIMRFGDGDPNEERFAFTSKDQFELAESLNLTNKELVAFKNGDRLINNNRREE